MAELQKLGEGSNGEVYLCNQRLKDELLPIKRIRSLNNASQHGFAIKFGRDYTDLPLASNVTEYNLLNRLTHPRIIPMRGIVRWTEPTPDVNPLGLVLPRAAGDLAEIVKQRIVEPQAQLYLVADALLALEYLHGQGYIHRDIKEANILVLPEADLTQGPSNKLVAVLADLGSVYDLSQPAGFLLPDQCTPFYAAPEASTKNYGKPSDVWSVAVMIISIFTGWRPPSAYTWPHLTLDLPTEAEYQAIGLRERPFTHHEDDHWITRRALLEHVLGPESVGLLAVMLHMNPSRRPTITEVLDSALFEPVRPYIQQLRRQTTDLRVVRSPRYDNLVRLPTTELGRALLKSALETYQVQPLSFRDQQTQHLFIQTLVLLDRFLPQLKLEPQLNPVGQTTVTLAVALSTVSAYYQDPTFYYDYLVEHSVLQESKYQDYAVDLSYQLLAAFSQGDLVVDVNHAALLPYLEA